MEFSFEFMIYFILIVLPIYGLYKNSVETQRKKEDLINKLENLKDDLVSVKSHLAKESLNIERKLEEMKGKLIKQEEIFKKDIKMQNEDNYSNKKLLNGLLNDIEEQAKGIKYEEKSFSELMGNLKANNSQISFE